MLAPSERRLLLRLARAAIVQELLREPVLDELRAEVEMPPALSDCRGVFVTLQEQVRESGVEQTRLRGCIGSMGSDRPLAVTTPDTAQRAAFEDPRFPPLGRDELDRMRISISIVSPLAPVETPDSIVPGRHGVELVRGGRRAVFLPQVALEQGWDRTQLLEQLAIKSGGSAQDWRDATLSTFTTESFGE